ncbi:hypothetical protein QE152_g796 [Popillia japonica]|uniref:Uncharacterized protein n=1 Tax=Popillia japonica TaxID=7064 RepID=A0AAW1NAZ1_POPJA
MKILPLSVMGFNKPAEIFKRTSSLRLEGDGDGGIILEEKKGLIGYFSVRKKVAGEQETDKEEKDKKKSGWVRCAGDGVATEEIVCGNAFLSIHGIKRKKIEYLVSSLKTTGNAPKDKRGKHHNHRSKLSEIVCGNAFLSIHGIKRKKIEYLVSSLKTTGNAPKDKRGKHHNHRSKLSDEILEAVRTHIKSFKSRTSHYGMLF